LWSIDEGGRVKRGKSRSSRLHGTGGREGVANMAQAVHQGGSGMSTGSGWRREGERDPRSVVQLGRLAV
jgi:hypothetical protein